MGNLSPSPLPPPILMMEYSDLAPINGPGKTGRGRRDLLEDTSRTKIDFKMRRWGYAFSLNLCKGKINKDN